MTDRGLVERNYSPEPLNIKITNRNALFNNMFCHVT